VNRSGAFRRLFNAVKGNDVRKLQVLLAGGVVEPADISCSSKVTLVALEHRSYELLNELDAMGVPPADVDVMFVAEVDSLPFVQSVIEGDEEGLRNDIGELSGCHSDFVIRKLRECAVMATKVALNHNRFRLLDVLYSVGFPLSFVSSAYHLDYPNLVAGINGVRSGSVDCVALRAVADDASVERLFFEKYSTGQIFGIPSLRKAFDVVADADLIIAIYRSMQLKRSSCDYSLELCKEIIKHNRMDVLVRLNERRDFPDALKEAIMFNRFYSGSETVIDEVDLVKFVLEHYPKRIEATHLGLTPFLWAAYFNYPATNGRVAALMEAKCNTRALGPREDCVTSIVTTNANVEWIKVLREAGINLNAPILTFQNTTSIRKGNFTPAFTAVHYGSPGHARFLGALVEGGGRVDEVDERGWTLLHYAAANWETHPDVVEVLVGCGVDVNAVTGDGLSALQVAYSFACAPGPDCHRYGVERVVERLVLMGADVLVGNSRVERDAVRNFGSRRVTRKNAGVLRVLGGVFGGVV
jgi:ankyrin repeat protein